MMTELEYRIALLKQIEITGSMSVVLMTPDALAMLMTSSRGEGLPPGSATKQAEHDFMNCHLLICLETRIDAEAQRRADLGFQVIVCKRDALPYRKEVTPGKPCRNLPDN